MRYVCPPSPTFSEFAFSQSSTLPVTPPDTSATRINSAAGSDCLSDAQTKELLDAAALALGKIRPGADHGMLAYSTSTAPMTAAAIAHRATHNSIKLKSYEYRAHLLLCREIFTEVLIHVGFRGAMLREPQYKATMHMARSEFVRHVTEAALLAELERFIATPITPAPLNGAGAAAAATVTVPSTSTSPGFINGHALLCLLGGGANSEAATLNIKLLNDNVHHVSIRQVSLIARKLKEQGLLKGFGISIDPAPAISTSTSTPTFATPVDSPLSIAAVNSFLTTLNTLLQVSDITRLTPSDLARFAIPPGASGARFLAPAITDPTDNTGEFTEYLRRLQGTLAYHSHPYIQKVELWADGMHQKMLQRWADREWQGGVFMKWRLGQEGVVARMAEMQGDRGVERERVVREREEERVVMVREKEQLVKDREEEKRRIEKDVQARIGRDIKAKMKKMRADLKSGLEANIKKEREMEKEQMKTERDQEKLKSEKGKLKRERDMDVKLEKIQAEQKAEKEAMKKEKEVLRKEREAETLKGEKDMKVTMEKMQAEKDAEKEALRKEREKEKAEKDAEKEALKKEREAEKLKREKEGEAEKVKSEAEKLKREKEREADRLRTDKDMKVKMEKMQADKEAEKEATKKEQDARIEKDVSAKIAKLEANMKKEREAEKLMAEEEKVKSEAAMDAKMAVWKAELVRQMLGMMTAGGGGGGGGAVQGEVLV